MLQKKVSNLLKYCGYYQAHGFMMDERNTDKEFNIRMPEVMEKLELFKILGIF